MSKNVGLLLKINGCNCNNIEIFLLNIKYQVNSNKKTIDEVRNDIYTYLGMREIDFEYTMLSGYLKQTYGYINEDADIEKLAIAPSIKLYQIKIIYYMDTKTSFKIKDIIITNSIFNSSKLVMPYSRIRYWNGYNTLLMALIKDVQNDEAVKEEHTEPEEEIKISAKSVLNTRYGDIKYAINKIDDYIVLKLLLIKYGFNHNNSTRLGNNIFAETFSSSDIKIVVLHNNEELHFVTVYYTLNGHTSWDVYNK